MDDQTPPDRASAPAGHDPKAEAPQASQAFAPPRPPSPPATPRPASGKGDAGAVLRRSPDPDRPGSWRVARPAISPSIVGNADGRDAARPPRPMPPPGFRRPASIVDTEDGPRPSGHGDIPSDVIVDMADGNGSEPFETMPAPGPVPTRLKDPQSRRAAGPSGPDDELVRRLREARKRKVADRAKARGRDPGAGSKPVGGGVTRSEKTHEQYLERGRMLVRRYRRETGLGDAPLDGLDPVQFVHWFFSLKPGLKPTAWRPYRQAAKAILALIPHDEVEAAIAMIDADVAEPSENARKPKSSSGSAAGGRAKLPRRTSALKEKRFPKEDYDRILSFLRHFSRSRFAPVLADWIVAGVATGLRPIEWQATDIEVKRDRNAPGGRWVWLYVLNAKATNGRSNGVVRTLDLSHFTDETLRAVQRMSKAGQEWLIEGTYDSMQSQCSQLLYSVSERLFRGRRVYSLYSTRHQFVANAKSYHRPEAVSALCGHVVTDTAATSYGKKRSCWEPQDIRDRADPVADEVATVRQRLVFFEERIRLQQEAGLLKAPKAEEG